MKHFLSILFTLVALFTFAFTPFAANGVLAYGVGGVQYEFEQTNVLDDLTGSQIGGNTFDLADYPYNEHGEPQIISFVEFCYSNNSENRQDFGMYIYVYNPQEIALDTRTTRNRIQMSFGNRDTYNKYALEFLNYSTRAGYEGRFYKFKITFTGSDLNNILTVLNPDSRVYQIVGVELSVGGVVTEYLCAQTYTYTGYAEGYGSELAVGDTLTCTVDGFDKYLTLDVHHTYYRPEGTNGVNRYTHDSLSSVYFAIPRDIADEYGRMTRIRGEYLRALTSEIFVTGDNTYYREFLSVLGQDVGYVTDDDVFKTMILAYEGQMIWGMSSDWMYHAPEAIADYYPDDRYFNTLNYLFNASSGDADTYDVSSADLQQYMSWYTENYSDAETELVAGRYAADLFEQFDTEMTVFDLTSDSETPDLMSLDISRTFWQALMGQETVNSTYYDGKEAIHVVTDDDFIYNAGTSEINVEATCDNLYIAESDYAEFRTFYELNKSDHDIYLIRFAVDDYASTEAVQCHFENVGYDMTGDPVIVYDADDANSNCYLAQMYVYLDFDIIDVTLTKDDVSTVIPVVMSPIDVIGDVTHPTDTQTDDGIGLWEMILIIIGLILLVVILWPLLPYIAKLIVFVISLPVKLIQWIIKTVKKE